MSNPAREAVAIWVPPEIQVWTRALGPGTTVALGCVLVANAIPLHLFFAN